MPTIVRQKHTHTHTHTHDCSVWRTSRLWIIGSGFVEDGSELGAQRAFLMYPESYCRADLNGDFRVDVLDLLYLLGAWGACPAVDVTVLTLSEELTEAGLTQQQWNDYYNTMTGGASQSVKDNWTCWMENYLSQCTSCPECPDDDPFAE